MPKADRCNECGEYPAYCVCGDPDLACELCGSIDGACDCDSYCSMCGESWASCFCVEFDSMLEDPRGVAGGDAAGLDGGG
jgi:hypothetical protein